MKLLILLAIVGAGVLGCNNMTNCGQCSEDKQKCEVCWGGYFNKGNCTTITAAIDNCLAYKDATNCQECQPGFYLGAGSKCTAIPAVKDCLFSISDGKCIACGNGKLVNTANTPPDCTGLDCKLSGCKACENASTCKLCNDDSTLKGVTCTASTGKLANCAIADNNDTCIKCKQNYRIIDGACTNISSNKSSNKSSKIVSVFALVAGILGMVLLSA